MNTEVLGISSHIYSHVTSSLDSDRAMTSIRSFAVNSASSFLPSSFDLVSAADQDQSF